MKKSRNIAALLTAILTATSMTVSLSAETTANTYLLGDVNLDGVIDEQDSNLLRSALWGQASLTDVQRTVADINGDLHVNYEDLFKLYNVIYNGEETSEVTVNADEDGNITHLLNDNAALEVDANGWTATVANTNTGASFKAIDLTKGSWFKTSAYALDATADGSRLFLNAYNANISNDYATMKYSNYGSSSDVTYSDGKISARLFNNGYMSFNDTYLNNSTSIMQKAAKTFSYISKDDEMFQPTDYSVGGKVQLINSAIGRTEDGFEFFNSISENTDTSYAFLGHKYASMDGVEFWFDPDTSEFTFSGVDEANVEINYQQVRNSYNGATIVPFNEISLVTDKYIYGLMYDPTCDWMCAFVRYDKTNGECTLAQYTAAGDRATIGTYYMLDGVVEDSLNHLDMMVENLDERYDPEGMVFETVMYRTNMKACIVGGINDSYRTDNGLTFTQTRSGLNILQLANSDKDAGTTVTFGKAYGSEILSFTNHAGGIEKFGNNMTYKVGSDSFKTDVTDSLFSPEKDITYSSGDISETFTINSLLDNRTATMY